MSHLMAMIPLVGDTLEEFSKVNAVRERGGKEFACAHSSGLHYIARCQTRAIQFTSREIEIGAGYKSCIA